MEAGTVPVVLDGAEVEEEPSPNLIDHHLLQSYKTLHQKLTKKRFVFNQRSNTEEGLTEVLSWIDQAKRLGDDPYVAFATLAAARCEQALGNPSKQAHHLINAGHMFFGLQMELEETKSLNFEENVAHAIDCYVAAIKIHLAQKRENQAGALYYEMASILERMGKHMEAATYFQAAAGLQLKYSPMGGLTSYQHAARCFLFQRDYAMAATTYHTIISQIPSLAIDPHDLEEVDVNEKKAAGGGGSGSKRRTVGGSSPPPKDAKRKPKPKEASEEPEPEVTATTAAGRKEPPLYFMPMDSFYTKALTGAKVCLLLLHLLQKQYSKARSLLRDFAPTTGDDGEAKPDRLLFTPPAGEPEDYPLLSVPGWHNSLHFALYSAVTMCETRDEGIMEEVKRELWQFLDRTQWDIFQLVLLDMRTSDVVYG